MLMLKPAHNKQACALVAIDNLAGSDRYGNHDHHDQDAWLATGSIKQHGRRLDVSSQATAQPHFRQHHGHWMHPCILLGTLLGGAGEKGHLVKPSPGWPPSGTAAAKCSLIVWGSHPLRISLLRVSTRTTTLSGHRILAFGT